MALPDLPRTIGIHEIKKSNVAVEWILVLLCVWDVHNPETNSYMFPVLFLKSYRQMPSFSSMSFWIFYSVVFLSFSTTLSEWVNIEWIKPRTKINRWNHSFLVQMVDAHHHLYPVLLQLCWIYFTPLHWIVLFISHPLNNQSSPGIWYSGDLTLHHWLSGYCYLLNKCVALNFGHSKSVKNVNKGWVVGMGRQLWPLVTAWNRWHANGEVSA